MADIDVLLAVQGASRATQDLGQFQQKMLQLREQIAQAGTIVSGFERGLDEMNRTGSVSIGTVASLASALPGLVNPATAAATAILGLVLANQKLKKAIDDINRAVIDDNRKALEEFWKAEFEGRREMESSSPAIRTMLRKRKGEIAKLAKVTQEYEVAQKRLNAEMGFTEALDDIRRRDLDKLTSAYFKNREEIKERVFFLGQEIEATKRQEEADKLAAEAKRQAAKAAAELNREAALSLEGFFDELPEPVIVTDFFEGFIAAASDAQMAYDDMVASMAETSDQLIAGTAVAAFDGFTDAMTVAIQASGRMGPAFAKAAKIVLRATLQGIGQEAAIKAGFQAVEAIAALAVGNIPGAALHGKAAAGYAAVATAAGVGAAALAPSAGGGGAGIGGGGGGGGGQRGGGGDVIQNVIVIGTLDATAAQDLNDQLATARETRDLSG